jgi:hypothetical protein
MWFLMPSGYYYYIKDGIMPNNAIDSVLITFSFIILKTISEQTLWYFTFLNLEKRKQEINICVKMASPSSPMDHEDIKYIIFSYSVL